ncbi:MAG: oxygen-dependent coproporphyrinogen oxidase [Bacteroidota bacterium]|nr:oxygen-dependent coproporphyrinogen oxidase [Bacteroidota bacterium]MDP4194580.1 oxygen-dependent coproporphyrinogen oxidase [Bacteroidota bacterium]
MKLSVQFALLERKLEDLQSLITRELEKLDTARFREDIWKRKEGGGGRTRIIENGKTFEKGGVSTSVIYGKVTEALKDQLKTSAKEFAVCGLSLVIHPLSPKIPTIHMNIRYFEQDDNHSWFGGGIDLTPYYPHIEDFMHFHFMLKKTCNEVIADSYIKFKAWCDEYFFIKHRGEMRGIGGVFFDYLDGHDRKHFQLAEALGDSFLDIYLPIVKLRMDEEWNKEDKEFQLVRRGRYVEFNLIYDRGTIFGLKSDGRAESILMSLPPHASFLYDWKPAKNSPYEKMLKYYQPQEWVK